MRPSLTTSIFLTLDRADIFFAFQDLRPPAFPLLAPSSLIMSTWPETQAPLPLSLYSMTSGFDEFRDVTSLAPLMRIVHNARLITIGFDAHLSRQADAPTLTRIVWARNFMTHDLLSLPLTIPDLPNTDSSEAQPHVPSPSSSINNALLQSLYNLMRLSAITYTLLVLFPMPRVTGLHAKLSQQLTIALDDCIVLDLWNTHPKLLLWATMLGGIVSDQGSPRSWFAEMTRQARTKIPNLSLTDSSCRSRSTSTSRQRSHSRSRSTPAAAGRREATAAWTIVRDICLHFLWFDGPECDGAGLAFWNESCENDLTRTRSDESSASAPFL